jgi:hypothetical protein
MDGTNGGTTFTDESATIKGSGSAKALTVTSVTTSTAASKFYGSSGYFGTGGSTPNISVSPVNSFSTSNFTIELWYYATASQNDRTLYRCVNGSQYGILLYMNGGILQVYISSNGSSWDLVSGTSIGSITTNQWTHIALVRNGSSFSGYMNGASTSLATSSSAIASGTTEQIGGNGSLSFPGYIQDARVYVGVAKYTTTFTIPSYSQSTAAGNDSLVDTPTSGSIVDTGLGGQVTGNYCTLNPLSNNSAQTTLTNGNLQASGAQGAGSSRCNSTFGLTSGKWYFETTFSASGANGAYSSVGIGRDFITSQEPGQDANSFAYFLGLGQTYNSNSLANYGSALSVGDVFMCAFDLDNLKVYFGKNGTWFGSSNPATGANPAFNLNSGTYTPTCRVYATSGTSQLDFNFGQRAFSYQAPSGFKAICDSNLPAPVVAKGSSAMDVLTWSGTGGARSLTGLNFSPDFVWGKQRNGANAHQLYDIVRGAGNNKDLASDYTAAEGSATTSASVYGYLSSFDSAGFSVANGTDGTFGGGYWNLSGRTYVAWAWDAGTTTVSNTQGSITGGSQVRANPAAGFSVVTYNSGSSTGNFTVGHGLNTAPRFLIHKTRGTGNWWVYHASAIDNLAKYLQLNSTNAVATNSNNMWGAAFPTSSVFGVTVGDLIGTNTDAVVYAFAPVSGYSSFGSYVGNGNATSGNFVYTGFRPRWVLYKASSSSGLWNLFDTARNPSNVANNELFASTSDAETSAYTGEHMDILSNGFRLVSNGSAANGSGVTYIYAAFAESPFQYARAR